MGNRSKIVRVANREFAVDRESVIRIYGDEDNNTCVLYNGEKFRIDNEYNLQNSEIDKSVKLTFESFETKITIPNSSNYSAYIEKENMLVTSGDIFTIENHMEQSSFMISEGDTIPTEGVDVNVSVEPVKFKSKEDVEERTLQKMYEDDTSIETLESEDAVSEDSESIHFSDLHALSDFENASYLDKIGFGAYRKVYEITDASKIGHITKSDNAVIKVAKNTYGVRSNKREFQTWCAVKGTHLEKYFCKILNRGPEFRYIVMKKADQVIFDAEPEERSSAKHEMRKMIQNEIEEDSIETPNDHGLDITYDNIGKMDGEDTYKFIDYPFGGSFQYLNQ